MGFNKINSKFPEHQVGIAQNNADHTVAPNSSNDALEVELATYL